MTPTPEKIQVLHIKIKHAQLEKQQLLFHKVNLFEKSMQWTIRCESNNKKNFDLYVQSQRPKILWKKEITVNELRKCADDDFSLTFENQIGAPQLVLKSQ